MMDSKVVFLCWSGTRSRQVAEALERALLGLECGLKPFRSPEISKGAIWFEQVRKGLASARVLIVCLTPENANGAWLHYEAGAVAAKIPLTRGRLEPRVFPYLFQMSAVDLTGPLSQFQVTTATQEDTLRLVRQLMPAPKWERWTRGMRARWWAKLEKDLHRAEDRPLEEVLPNFETLFRRKTFDEPLDECVNQAWPARWSGARDTHQRLKEKVAEVARQCRPYARELLSQLVEAVDGYAMTLELLLVPRSFKLRESGRREISPGLLVACEQRRNQIKDLLSGLADPRQAPVFEDAPRFERLRFSERKTLVHQFEAWLDHSKEEQSKDWRLAKAISSDEALRSRWDFDRVAYYLLRERRPPTLGEGLGWLRVEIEKARARDASHMPLTYCLGPLRQAINQFARGRGAGMQLKEARKLLEQACAIGRRREKEQRYPEPSRLRVEAEETRTLLKNKARRISGVTPIRR